MDARLSMSVRTVFDAFDQKRLLLGCWWITLQLHTLPATARFEEVFTSRPHISGDLSERHVIIVESQTRQVVDAEGGGIFTTL